MSKRLESVEITFENLDYINIPVEYFGEFYITGMQTTVERLAHCQSQEMHIIKSRLSR